MPKVRLTYNESSQGQPSKDEQDEPRDQPQEIKDTPSTKASETSDIEQTQATNVESKMESGSGKKVPPLKIVLSSRVIEDITDEDRASAEKATANEAENSSYLMKKRRILTRQKASNSKPLVAVVKPMSKIIPVETPNEPEIQPEIGPERPEIQPERPETEPERPEIEPERPEIQPERPIRQAERPIRQAERPTRQADRPIRQVDRPVRPAEEQVPEENMAEEPKTEELSEYSDHSVPVKKRKHYYNDVDKFVNLRRQVEQKRKNVFPVYPKPPEGYKDYLMNKKTYLLQENAKERLRSMPLIHPPASLKGALRDLFIQQERDRFKLRTKHLVEKEKLVLAVEQVGSPLIFIFLHSGIY